MRPKELRIIVTFETTTAAMAFESEAKKRQIGGRLIQQLQYQQVLELII